MSELGFAKLVADRRGGKDASRPRRSVCVLKRLDTPQLDNDQPSGLTGRSASRSSAFRQFAEGGAQTAVLEA